MTEKFKKLQKLYATVTQMSGGAFDYAATRSSTQGGAVELYYTDRITALEAAERLSLNVIGDVPDELVYVQAPTSYTQSDGTDKWVVTVHFIEEAFDHVVI